MRFLGVRVNLEAANELKNKLSSEEKECLQKVKIETGVDTQIWAARSIAQVFEKLRLPHEPNTPNTCLLYTSDAADE